MADHSIPPTLTELQRSVDAAREAVHAHQRGIDRPVLEWTPDERAEADRLHASWVEAATELQAAIEADGREVGDSYAFRRSLRAAAYPET